MTLRQMATQLETCAKKHDLAVVVMNQVTTKLSQEGNARLVPALGDTWSHIPTQRLFLDWERRSARGQLMEGGPELLSAPSPNATLEDVPRVAKLLKSNKRRTGRALFRICNDGVRDLPLAEDTQMEDDTQGGARGSRGALPQQSFVSESLDQMPRPFQN